MQTDVLVIGGGIAGLSAAAWLSAETDVIVVEAEEFLGYHTTGRSAALYTECYGDGPIRRLTIASREFLTSHDSVTSPLPVLFVGGVEDADVLDEMYEMFSPLVPTLERVSPTSVAELCAAFEPDATSGGLYEPLAMELDVDALQTLYTRTSRDNGATILTSARVRAIERVGSTWTVHAGEHQIEASIIVNASGAWGDAVAEIAGVRPLGLTPLLRSVFTTTSPMPNTGWPFVADAKERWYFKPEGPNILGSAESEIPSPPCDARTPEIDIALGIERINEATTFSIRSVNNTWAGLRTFTPDRVPGIGYDTEHDGFFWLVGQGGYGIMTSPAIGEVASSLILTDTVPQRLVDLDFTRGSVAPERFRP
ncbi:MAG: FAD-binding oxidoreductase [Actinomycetia bacterium]|nr:FAD-binding oxidoreductase [Actinomycetes bacterium]